MKIAVISTSEDPDSVGAAVTRVHSEVNSNPWSIISLAHQPTDPEASPLIQVGLLGEFAASHPTKRKGAIEDKVGAEATCESNGNGSSYTLDSARLILLWSTNNSNEESRIGPILYYSFIEFL